MPRTRTVMRRVREVLRLKFELGLNDSEVARGTGVARSTVQDHLRRIERLFGPRERRDTSRPLPDWESIERQLRGRGVTLRLLWTEYLDANGKGYKYSHYVAAELIVRWAVKAKVPVRDPGGLRHINFELQCIQERHQRWQGAML